jgi:hypothetical protein
MTGATRVTGNQALSERFAIADGLGVMIDRREAGVITQRSVLPGDLARADAFRALAEEHLDASFALARAILRDPTRFEPWFGRIVVNTCSTRLSARARSRVTEIPTRLLPTVRNGATSVVRSRADGSAPLRLED